MERGRSRKRIPGVSSNAGFMCQKVEGVVLGMRALLEDADRMAERDFSVVPLNWRSDLFDTPRCVTFEFGARFLSTIGSDQQTLDSL